MVGPCININCDSNVGKVTATRTCTNPQPQNGGAGCNGDASYFQFCYVNCSGKCVVKEPFLCTILLHTNTCLPVFKVLINLPFFASL